MYYYFKLVKFPSSSYVETMSVHVYFSLHRVRHLEMKSLILATYFCYRLLAHS